MVCLAGQNGRAQCQAAVALCALVLARGERPQEAELIPDDPILAYEELIHEAPIYRDPSTIKHDESRVGQTDSETAGVDDVVLDTRGEVGAAEETFQKTRALHGPGNEAFFLQQMYTYNNILDELSTRDRARNSGTKLHPGGKGAVAALPSIKEQMTLEKDEEMRRTFHTQAPGKGAVSALLPIKAKAKAEETARKVHADDPYTLHPQTPGKGAVAALLSIKEHLGSAAVPRVLNVGTQTIQGQKTLDGITLDENQDAVANVMINVNGGYQFFGVAAGIEPEGKKVSTAIVSRMPILLGEHLLKDKAKLRSDLENITSKQPGFEDMKLEDLDQQSLALTLSILQVDLEIELAADREPLRAAWELCKKNEPSKLCNANWPGGSTTVLALAQGSEVWVANVGDSRAILIEKNATGQYKAERLTSDQTLDVESEGQRIKDLNGALIYRSVNTQGYAVYDKDCYEWKVTARECAASLRVARPQTHNVSDANDSRMTDLFQKETSNDSFACSAPIARSPMRTINGRNEVHKVARMIGCSAIMKEIVIIARPSVTKHTIVADDAFIVIASSGYWKVIPDALAALHMQYMNMQGNDTPRERASSLARYASEVSGRVSMVRKIRNCKFREEFRRKRTNKCIDMVGVRTELEGRVDVTTNLRYVDFEDISVVVVALGEPGQ